MQIKLDELPNTLKKNLLPVYLISGDDVWLAQNAVETITQHAIAQGFSGKPMIHIEKDVHWEALALDSQNRSFFVEKHLYKVTLKKNSISKSAQAILQAQYNNPDSCTIIICSKLSANDKKLAWIKKLNTHGAIIDIWPLFPNQVPTWIKQRAAHYNVILQSDGIQMIAALSQNNLMAADQALYKLSLISTTDTLSKEIIVKTLTNQSRYTVFDLLDSIANAQGQKMLTILKTLEQEDSNQISMVLYLVMQELEEAFTQNYVGKTYLGKNKIKRLEQLSRRLSQKRLLSLLAKGREVEKAIKGCSIQQPWLLISIVCSAIIA